MLKEEISILRELISEAVPLFNKMQQNSFPTEENDFSQQNTDPRYFSGRTLQEIAEVSKSELYGSTVGMALHLQENLEPSLSQLPFID